MNSYFLDSILLVDDDEISNLFNKIFIGKLDLDVEVDIFKDGQEALDFLSPKNTGKHVTSVLTPSLLLLDIKMPRMDGWEFLKAYKDTVDVSIRENIVIVMLTTSADEGDMVKALQDPNVKEFIQKPLSEKKFRKVISEHFIKDKVQ
jgi:CheY-like chemotaxis protein